MVAVDLISKRREVNEAIELLFTVGLYLILFYTYNENKIYTILVKRLSKSELIEADRRIRRRLSIWSIYVIAGVAACRYSGQVECAVDEHIQQRVLRFFDGVYEVSVLRCTVSSGEEFVRVGQRPEHSARYAGGVSQPVFRQFLRERRFVQFLERWKYKIPES